MTASRNRAGNLPEEQDADGADIRQRGYKIEEDILGLREMVQDAKLKHGTVPAETARAIANIRAALELLESEYLVNAHADATAEEVHLVKTAALGLLNQKASELVTEKVDDEIPLVTPSSESAELTEKEIDEWDAQVKQRVESLGIVPACVQNMVDPGKRNAEAYNRLQIGAYELADKSGMSPFILRGGQTHQGESQRNDLRLSLISSITMASDLLADVRGLRGGKHLHEGFMHDKAGYAAARNLSSAITQLYPVLDELGIPQAQRASLKEMCDEAATVKLIIANEEKNAIAKSGARARDFSGGFDTRGRSAARKLA